jgi:mRNA interferase MazF
MVAAGSSYVPERGDLVWLSFDPRAGHEQAGRRPALVLSPAAYNAKSGLMLACPITSRVKGYPFEVALPSGLPIAGVVLADQIRSLDWAARRAEKAGEVPKGVLAEVVERIGLLLSI